MIWDDKTANTPLVFANDIEFIRGSEDQLSLYVDGAAFEGTVYGTEYGNIDKSSPFWEAWISALEGSGSAIQYYKVKGTDDNGQTKDDVVVDCRPVSVLGAPSVYGKRILYEEAVRENGMNMDKWKLIKVNKNSVISPAVLVTDDDLFNYEYAFTVDGKEYRSELLPYVKTNFVIKPMASPNLNEFSMFDILKERFSGGLTFEDSWQGYISEALYSVFFLSPANSHSDLLTTDELRAFLNVLDGEKQIYWNRTDQPLKGDAVMALQKLLGNVRVTGEFKQATENAVEDFLTSNRISFARCYNTHTVSDFAAPFLYGSDNYIKDTNDMQIKITLSVAAEVIGGYILGWLFRGVAAISKLVLRSALEKAGASPLFSRLIASVTETIGKRVKGAEGLERTVQALENVSKKVEPGVLSPVDEVILREIKAVCKKVVEHYRKWNSNPGMSDLWLHSVDYFTNPKYAATKKARFLRMEKILEKAKGTYSCGSDNLSKLRFMNEFADDALDVVKRGLAKGDCYYDKEANAVYVAVKGKDATQYAAEGVMVKIRCVQGETGNRTIYSFMDITNGWQQFETNKASKEALGDFVTNPMKESITDFLGI